MHRKTFVPLLRRFKRDTRAVSAVEFAMLAPVMILLLLGSLDVVRAVEAKNKLSILARTISDFVSQNTSVSQSDLTTILQAARSVMYPYRNDPSVLTVKIDSIRLNASNPALAYSDWRYHPPASPSKNDVSSAFVPSSSSVIRTEVTYQHDLRFLGPLLGGAGLNSITMTSTSMMVPRWATFVDAGW